MLSDLKQCQSKIKELKVQLGQVKDAEEKARAEAHEHHLALKASESSLRDKTASSKLVINSLQLEIKTLKSK